MHDLIQELTDLLGAAGILTEASDRAAHEEDWRGRYRGEALCVALPKTTGDVSGIVMACARHGAAIVPQGGNTGLSGGSIPTTPNTVIISTRRMNRIETVDAVEGSMIVGAGCILMDIHAAAEAAGWVFPLHLGAEGSCQIGGNISTNAGGTSVVRYGNTRDLILGLEVVLPSGDIWDGLRSLRKNNSGYDLKHLFIGAEGTIGIITRAALKLYPKPAESAAAWVGLSSVQNAIAFASKARKTLDTSLSAVELMNAEQVRLVLKHVANTRKVYDTDYPYYVLVEASSMRADGSIRESLEELLGEALEAGLIEDAVTASNLSQASEFWAVRHGVAQANRAEGMGITMDAAVPVSRVSAFIAEANAKIASDFPEARPVIVSHLGDGNVHYIAMVPAQDWETVGDKPDYVHRVRVAINDITVKQHRGSFSAEHGVGQTFVPEVGRYKSDVELKLLHGVKDLLDPRGLFNPKKLLPSS
ncbi:MAG: FAD-binding oxidoreductase [Mesorhizobium sp.]